MKIFRKAFLYIIAGVIVATSGAYFLVLGSGEGIPDGMYSSYDFYPHDTADVLDFSGGVVMSRTCCGDSNWGSYDQNDNGVWVWRYSGPIVIEGTTILHPDPDPIYFILHRNRFSLTIERQDEPVTPLKMRRRLFQRIRL